MDNFFDRTVTGIGKTVNMCRRFEGEVGRLAADVVDQWKSLVDKAERSSRGNSSECYASKSRAILCMGAGSKWQ